MFLQGGRQDMCGFTILREHEVFFTKKVMNRSHCIRSFLCPGFLALES